MRAHWWVELRLGPLVGRAVPRGMSGGDCGLRKSLGSLSVDAWGCVPALWVAWPEVSPCWSLQAVRRGQVSVPRTQDACLQPEFTHR